MPQRENQTEPQRAPYEGPCIIKRQRVDERCTPHTSLRSSPSCFSRLHNLERHTFGVGLCSREHWRDTPTCLCHQARCPAAVQRHVAMSSHDHQCKVRAPVSAQHSGANCGFQCGTKVRDRSDVHTRASPRLGPRAREIEVWSRNLRHRSGSMSPTSYCLPTQRPPPARAMQSVHEPYPLMLAIERAASHWASRNAEHARQTRQ